MTPASLRRIGRRRNGAAGFLLTETLATFTISAFVLFGLVSSSSVLLRAVDRSVAHAQDVDDLGRTLNAIARDVSSLARARWNGVEPQPFVFRGGPNSLFFAKTQKDAGWPDETHVIALREIVVGQGTRLTRSEARLSARATGFDTLFFSPPRELGTGATRLRFFYVPARVGQTQQPRVSTWPTGPLLPVAIIIEAVERDTARVILSVSVPVRANADIGCLEQDADQAPSVSQQGPAAQSVGFCGAPHTDKASDAKRNGIAPPGQVSSSTTGGTF